MKKILIVDDSQDIITSLVDFLEEEEYQVQYALDAYSALEITKTFLPDLVICDILMPGMDGYGYYKEIKKTKLTAEIPIIFITASTDKNELQRGEESGARYFIVKPYNLLDLLKIIKIILKD